MRSLKYYPLRWSLNCVHFSCGSNHDGQFRIWIVQIIDNNLSQPIIFSKSVSSHPLEIFLVILIAGFLFGILGMIIAVPLFTILKVIGKEFFPDNKVIQLLTKNI